ncbi:TIM-barrel domain-containing protein [Altericista sp. CCNU0014]|uniref:TIM-barrel domain-containing protein n=1 Tax=Altericista sp. CCNU0014 TaxID=3082949 RepID=UPI003851622F
MNWTKQLSLKIKFFLGSLFYLSYAPKAFRYSRWKEKVEREVAVPPPQITFKQPGMLLRAEQIVSGARLYFERAELEICFLTPDLVRIDWKPGTLPIPYAIARQTWAPVATRLDKTADGWVVTSQVSDALGLKLVVAIDGRVTVFDALGKVVRKELPPEKLGEGWVHRSQLYPEEAIYGLGERSVPLNLRLAKEVTDKQEVTETPKTFRMWNYDAAGKYDTGADPMYICIPLYWGLHHAGSYLVFYENSFDAQFTFSEIATATFEGGALRYYIAVGPPAQLLERYTELTGRAPMPPRWALGYHQSHWGYKTEEAVRAVYQGFEAHHLPLSAIHLDIDVQVGYRAFTIDPDRFPKLSGFIGELLEHGVQFVTILNPGIKLSRKSNLFLEGRVLDAFCRLSNGQLVVAPVWPGWCVFPDFTNAAVRRWWSRQYEFLLDVGVAGFWHDMDEPAAFILWGDRVLVYPILQNGQRSRTVNLPNGRWYDFWDDGLLEGQVTLDAPLEKIPVLVKAGTILPMEEGESFNLLPQKSFEEKHLALHLYPPDGDTKTDALTLYTDIGDGYDASRLDRFSMQRLAGGLDLTWESEGEFIFPYISIQIYIYGMDVRQAWVDGEAVAVRENRVEISNCFASLHLSS